MIKVLTICYLTTSLVLKNKAQIFKIYTIYLLDDPPQVDLMSSMPGVQYGRYGDNLDIDEVEGYRYLPLPAVVEASITGPLTTQ